MKWQTCNFKTSSFIFWFFRNTLLEYRKNIGSNSFYLKWVKLYAIVWLQVVITKRKSHWKRFLYWILLMIKKCWMEISICIFFFIVVAHSTKLVFMLHLSCTNVHRFSESCSKMKKKNERIFKSLDKSCLSVKLP